MSTSYRTHTCGALRETDVGQRARLCGWVHTIREHASVLFVDLRDRYGRTQLVIERGDDADSALREAAGRLRAEWVVAVEGEVVKKGKANPKLATGAIELRVAELTVLGEARELPIEVASEDLPGEELRFRHRHLDLRRAEHGALIERRHRVVKALRDHLDEASFVEVETPILNRRTPEGARDFLVPSRTNRGRFYALPQSPQLMKQLLMVSGLDRYYQVARCFRDEDLRADRQPEFTQLDLEMSFVSEDDVLALIEGAMARVWKDVLGEELSLPFERITHHDAIERYGIDRPDLRFGLELIDLGEHAAGCGFGVFEKAAEGGRLKAIRVPGGAKLSRKQISALEKEAKEVGAKGLAWLKAKDGALEGPIAKFFAEGRLDAIREATGACDGDLLLFGADSASVVHAALARVRGELTRHPDLGFEPSCEWAFCWVVDFPMFSRDEETGELTYEHHPFTSPVEADLERMEAEPESVGSRGYDLVLNGYELGGGSIRIHRRDVQERVFAILGLTPEQVQEQFGWFVDTLDHGAPPHGGLALGVDRIAMLLGGKDSIREVMAFPKSMTGACYLTEAPSPVDAETLAESGVAALPSDGEDG